MLSQAHFFLSLEKTTMNKKITNFIIFIRCGIHALLHGSTRNIPKNPKAIAVFQLAQMGDMVCTTPVFRAIKNQYPNARLYVIGQPIFRELLRYNADVDEYIPHTEFHVVRQKLISASIDYAISVAPSFTALSLAYLSGAKAIAVPHITNGFSPNATLPYRILSKLVITKPHRMGSYAPREYLRLLEPICIVSEDTTKHLGYSRKAGNTIERFFQKQGVVLGDLIIGVSPSSGNKIKNWGADRFARVADYIYERYHARIIVLGGPVDEDEVTALLKHLKKSTPVINTLKLFSIDETKALIAKMHILIAVDTGPIYIAEAFRVATIDIVGPVDEHEQPPVGPRNLLVVPERTRAEIHIMDARSYDEKEARRQVDSIPYEKVCDAVDRLLSGDKEKLSLDIPREIP